MSKSICFVLSFLLVPLVTQGWGFQAHKKINRLAVFTLPKGLFAFYKAHVDEITEWAVKADQRKSVVKGEAPKHYCDLDHYEKVLPFDTVPVYWENAISKYSLDTLEEYGTNPWNSQFVYQKLIAAFEQKNEEQIVKISADLGHYLADIHVPLHSTLNYDGQLSGQRGIHSLWETKLVKHFVDDYNLLVGKAQYIKHIPEKIWERQAQSFALVDSVLYLEKLVSKNIGARGKYQIEKNGSQTRKYYSNVFCEAYHNVLNGMVERRMRHSIEFVGAVWYSAWVDAGKPKLDVY